MTDLSIDGMALAPGVVETIVSIAASEVEGVVSVGQLAADTLLSKIGKKSAAQGVEVTKDEQGNVGISVHVEVRYGSVLPELAAQLRSAVAEALATQVGLDVASVDVYVDGITFAR